MGMVIASVKVAQGEDLSAFTTTRPITARRIVMIASTASCAIEAAAFADLLARHLAERFSVAPNRTKKNDKILHAARKRRSGNQPERARQVAELRGERRADERARSRDGGKMVAKREPICS